MVRSKVFYVRPKKLAKKVSRWLKKKKLAGDKIISMTQSSHVSDPGDLHPLPWAVLTILYKG